jgi:sterol desaturase/sphingolipid hydroxylase (fatty acid hydroxylase superfamily)
MEELLGVNKESYSGIIQALEAVSVVFTFIIVGEFLYDYLWRKEGRDFRQSFVDIGLYILHEISIRFGGALIFLGALKFVSDFRVHDISSHPLTWVLLIVFVDFCYYWSHRLEHRSRLFWTWHSVHHSSHEFSATTALRLSWLEPLVSWYLLIPAVVIGFDPMDAFIALQILLQYQTWIHSKKIGKLGWFEHFFNSPSHHRVHHGANPEYLDKNYGALLIIWDRMFGTYKQETVSVQYGLTHPIGTNNLVKVNIREFQRMAHDLSLVKGVKQILFAVLGPPDWSPQDGLSTLSPRSYWNFFVKKDEACKANKEAIGKKT